MADEYTFYPKARLSKGAGDLQQVTDIGLKRSKGRKNIGTLRKPLSGYTDGEHSCELTFKASIPKEGFERDWDGDFKSGTVSQYRLKLPGGVTYTIVGVLDEPDIQSTVGGAIEFSAKIIGSCD